MKKSRLYPNHETNHYNGDEDYDPRADFSQFLEEAKRDERKTDFGIISSAESEEDGKIKPHQEETKNKKKKAWKPWKVFLLPLWKGEKKSKHHMEQEANFSHVSITKRGFASGPVYHSSGKDTDGRPRRLTSGPLSSLFSPARKADSEIPYMCLDKLNTPRFGGARTYGPVYLVT
ncbi:hypothetical protein L484_017987 [Morus notabilis]|uniref:Uncharacterized protein n=1 Tax=Morus notabilis TaxID=981085 RepID=W9RA75_9ROSA|nr:uncharacterized protein LOC21400969 [Morus notabilis]EXB64654.1 hypothetical protein L484_017987 [Morus notabilis]